MPDALLAVARFPSSTGFAWKYITSLYVAVGEAAVRRGLDAYIAYPEIDELPEHIRDSPVEAVELDVLGGLSSTLGFIRRQGVRTLWIPDWYTWDLRYSAWRAAGVERIVLHDHTSGARTVPTGLKRGLKRLRRVVPGSSADVAVAVSDYVARRLVDVELFPPGRVVRIHNSVTVPDMNREQWRARLRDAAGLTAGALVVACACRATQAKGVDHLMRAFDGMLEEWDVPGREPALVYIGDGPALPGLQALRTSLVGGNRIRLIGYRPDAASLLGGADLAVVPSVWEEAFGLGALEPAAHGVPVVASRIGGIPEVVEHDTTGLLIPPGDEAAMTDAMRRLLADPDARARMGHKGRAMARERFDPGNQLERLKSVVLGGAS